MKLKLCKLNDKLTKNTTKVLDKTLKGICCARLDNQKFLRAPGPRTKYYQRCFFRSINYINNNLLNTVY